MKHKSGTNSHINGKKSFKEYIQNDLVIYTCEKKKCIRKSQRPLDKYCTKFA